MPLALAIIGPGVLIVTAPSPKEQWQSGAAEYNTYSAYERGLDGLWGMYRWLDRAPLGRNETGFWWRRHDEYDSQ